MKVHTANAGRSIFSFSTLGLALGIAYGVIATFHQPLPQKLMAFGAVCAFEWFIFKKGQSSSYANAQAWAQANVDIAIEVSNIARAQALAQANAYSVAISQANATANNSMVVQLDGGKLIPISASEDHQEVRSIEEVKDMGAMREYADIWQELELVKSSSVISEDTENPVETIKPLGIPVYPSHKDFGHVFKVFAVLFRRPVKVDSVQSKGTMIE